jgi:hypothetical protein
LATDGDFQKPITHPDAGVDHSTAHGAAQVAAMFCDLQLASTLDSGTPTSCGGRSARGYEQNITIRTAFERTS